MNIVYENPVRRRMAEGALDFLPEWLRSIGSRRALFVMGGKSFRASDRFCQLKKNLSGISIEESAPVPENPSVPFIEQFCARTRGGVFDAVVAIGGGSALDAGKMMAVLFREEPGILAGRIAGRRAFASKRLPLAAVPTTSGTGSEVTPYVSLQTEEKKKVTLTDARFFPDLALVDPLLTLSLPPAVTASTGFDVLSQAIEAFWSVYHTSFSDTHALRAASLTARHLARAVKYPGDRVARFGMALASCESGLAIANTATTAVHAVSYPITTFFGVPHGHACALTLAEFIRFNEESMRENRYADLWHALGVRSASEAADWVERLMNEVGLESRLERLGIDARGIECIVANGFRPDRVKNNPRLLTPEVLREILQKIH